MQTLRKDMAKGYDLSERKRKNREDNPARATVPQPSHAIQSECANAQEKDKNQKSRSSNYQPETKARDFFQAID